VFVFLLVGFLSLSKTVSAVEPVAAPEQEGLQMVTVATVNIYDAKITEQTGNVFKISFDLSNRTGVQPQVIYGISLTRTDENSYIVADEKVFSSEVVSLGENETKKINITYEAPKYLKGKYVPVLNAKNGNALPLAISTLNEVTLDGQGDSLEITNCFLSVKEDNDPQKKYELLEGVDVEKNETLFGNCTAVGSFAQETAFAPTLTTFYRSSFGKEIRKDSLKEVIVKPNEKIDFQFQIPIAADPQAYSDILVFADKNGNQISNKVEFHYVVRGLSATVQNIRLDKDAYEKGDIANANFFWTGSADSFPNSRKGPTTFDDGKIDIMIQSGAGQECGKINQTLARSSEEKELNFSIPISIKCLDPVLRISISDKDGNKLSNDVFNIKSKPVEQTAAKYSKNVLFVIIFLVASLIAVLAFLFKDKLRGESGMFLLLMLFSGGIFFFGSGVASADTLTVTAPSLSGNIIYDWQEPGFNHAVENKLRSGTLVVSYNKASYAPSENMTVSMSSYYSWCSNTSRNVEYKWGSNGTSGSSISVTASRIGFGFNPVYTSAMSVPVAAGNYSAFFTAGFYTAANDGECRKEVITPQITYDEYGSAVQIYDENGSLLFTTEWQVVDCPSIRGTSYFSYNVVAPVIPKTGTDGVCGSASGGTFATLTATSPNLCGIGMSVLSFSGTGPWTWYCSGINGGADSPQCSANKTAVASCLDGIKNGTETGVDCGGTCPACAAAAFCGDGSCNGVETSITCPADCSVSAFCGDGTCNGSETTATCPSDCPAAAIPKPSFTLSASPSIIDLESASLPRTITLTWSPVSNATSCLKSPTMGGGNAAITGGTATVSQSSSSATYFIICSGPGGQTQKSATVQTRCTNTTCISSNTICDINYIYNIATNTCSKECTTNASCSAALPTTSTTTGGNQIPWMEVTP